MIRYARFWQEASQKLLEVEKWSPKGDDVAFGNTTFVRRLHPTGRPPWTTLIFFEVLGQVSSGEAGSIFRNFLRGSVRHLISEVMAEEVTALCGSKHHAIEADYTRVGSSAGRVLIDGQRDEVVRPRVRQQGDAGVSSDVQLETYQAANDTGELLASIIQALSSQQGFCFFRVRLIIYWDCREPLVSSQQKR